MIELRNYQQQSVDEIRQAFTQGFKHPLLVSPTGSGKTCIFSYIAHGAAAKGNRVHILSHRQELIRQISNTLKDFSVPHGIIRSGIREESFHLTQVASVQSLVRRVDNFKEPDLIIVDEAHHSTSETFKKIFAAYPNAKRLGVTATPSRMDGSGLGAHFDKMIMGPSVKYLIENGFLARPVYYAPPNDIDRSDLHITAGDYNKSEIEIIMDRPRIIGNAVEHYTKICAGKPAIAFCVSIKHAEHVTDSFQRAGYAAEMIDGTMDDKTRALRVASLGDGRLNVLVSIDLVGEGFDLPVVTAGIELRPTASLAVHLQHMGRVLRAAPGKACAYWIDHVGNCLRHGLAEEPREWSLDSKRKRPRKSDDDIVSLKTCPKCFAVFSSAPVCPECKFELPVKSREIEQVAGELKELTPEELAIRRAHQSVGMAGTREQLEIIRKQRGYKPSWVDMITNARLRKKLKAKKKPYISGLDNDSTQALLL